MKNISAQQHGFTLVELAIVLMIIGLLIGGILRGQELMENARVTSTIQQTKSYSAAANTFADTYGALPGDFSMPATRLPNCTDNPCNTPGNSDGMLSHDPSGFFVNVNSKSYAGGWNFQTENTTFWYHLSATHMISGINSKGNQQRGVWGDSFPAARMGGGFLTVYANIPANNAEPAVSGNFALLKATPLNGSLNDGPGTSATSPLRAAQLDRKMDDGLPQSGSVIGIGTQDCQGPTYRETSSQNDCNLLIKL